MVLSHSDKSSGGIIRLIFDEKDYAFNSHDESDKSLLTIAWNKGVRQSVLVDDKVISIDTHQAMIFSAGQSFAFEDLSAVVMLQFNRDFYCIIDHDYEVSCAGLLFYGQQSTPVITLTQSEQRKHRTLFQVFLEEFEEPDDSLKGEMLRILLKRLIVKLTRTYKEQSELAEVAHDDQDAIRKFNLLVEQHFKEYHQVQDYANLLNKSPKTISNLFCKYSKRTPLEIVHERILLEAKRLLIYTNKSTKEIARELGFNDIPSFSRFFKKNLDLAPSHFRTSHDFRKKGKIDNT